MRGVKRICAVSLQTCDPFVVADVLGVHVVRQLVTEVCAAVPEVHVRA
jgi:hypothetical protein